MIDFILAHASSVALVGFFSGFLFIVATVMRPSCKAELDRHAQIPLKEPE